MLVQAFTVSDVRVCREAVIEHLTEEVHPYKPVSAGRGQGEQEEDDVAEEEDDDDEQETSDGDNEEKEKEEEEEKEEDDSSHEELNTKVNMEDTNSTTSSKHQALAFNKAFYKKNAQTNDIPSTLQLITTPTVSTRGYAEFKVEQEYMTLGKLY